MKKRKGLTLVEMIITIAIISILAVTVLSMFNISVTSIFKSGKRTERVYKIKEEVDKDIIINEGNTTGTVEIIVTLPGNIEKTIKGTIIEKQNSDDPNIKITTFVPNK